MDNKYILLYYIIYPYSIIMSDNKQNPPQVDPSNNVVQSDNSFFGAISSFFGGLFPKEGINPEVVQGRIMPVFNNGDIAKGPILQQHVEKVKIVMDLEE